MHKYVLALQQVRQDDAPVVGGKAATLGTLLEAGFPAPPGLCLTTTAFKHAMQPYQQAIDAILKHHHPQDPVCAEQIAGLLADLTVPANVLSEVADALPALAGPHTPLAVRSSATAEDRDDASFAGQYASVLGVRGRAAVQAAILTCWRSFFSPHALAARTRHAGFAPDDAMAVLIQPMIDAECAGVCFSVDPVEGRRDLVLVEAAWGLGAGVVDGVVKTDSAWVQRNGFMVERQRIAEKPEQLALDPLGAVQRIATAAEHRTAACLPTPWLQRIAQYGVAAEVLLGSPQDVEWAISSGQVWILQSRPITTLPDLEQRASFPVTWENAEEQRQLWTRNEFPISAHKPPLPLETESVLAKESTRAETCRWMGADRNRRVKVVNGYTYSCATPHELLPGDVRVRRAAWDDLRNRLNEQGLTIWDLWGPEIVKATERLRAFDAATADGPALAAHLEDALGVFRRHWMLHPMCSFQPLRSYFKAYAALTGQGETEAEAAANQLLAGEENSLTRLIDGLYDLAQTARRAPGVMDLLAVMPDDIFARLEALTEAIAFISRFRQFLALFGERTGDGYGSNMSLSTPTWREQPELVLSLVKRYLASGMEAPRVARRRAQQARDAQMEALCRACPDPVTVDEFRRQLATARKTMTVLEEHNHYIDQMATGQLRLALMAAAEWLVAQSVLAAREDLFWLRFDEVLNSLRRPIPLAAAIQERQAQHAQWSLLEPPPLLGAPTATLPLRPPLQGEATLEHPGKPGYLTGVAASAGIAQGRARVLHDLAALPDLVPGDILVAENAGPLWTPFFPLLGGLVLERGSVLQHAATTAREYGVPAVIGVGMATRHIRDGAWVTVNGTTGSVAVETDR
jgi:pyruvate,water dikinase